MITFLFVVLFFGSDSFNALQRKTESCRESYCDPSFDVPVVNVTVVQGKVAILPCSINSLSNNKVIWMDPRSKLLTLQETRIITDDRISLERPFMKEWNLHIRNVKASDSGDYTCQINTTPVRIKKVLLTVHVPAQIIEHLSSDDIICRELETITLICNATGIPHPKVKWYRISDYENERREEEIGVEGEVLIIHNITRYCDDIYECIAYNGIGTGSTKQIDVSVQYAPEVMLPSKRMGQTKGKDTILMCRVNSNPLIMTVWRRNGAKISNSWKYQVEVYKEGEHIVSINMRIRALDDGDFGEYECFAQNQFGEDREKMILYDLNPRTTTTTTTRAPPIWYQPKPDSDIPIYYNKLTTGKYEPIDKSKYIYEDTGDGVSVFTQNPIGSGRPKNIGQSRQPDSAASHILLLNKSTLLLCAILVKISLTR